MILLLETHILPVLSIIWAALIDIQYICEMRGVSIRVDVLLFTCILAFICSYMHGAGFIVLPPTASVNVQAPVKLCSSSFVLSQNSLALFKP